MSFTEEECRSWLVNKCVNPKTNRKINPLAKNGLYLKLQTACKERNLFVDLEQCWNDEDPITFDDLKTKTSDEIIMIASSHNTKKHCFLVESLFQYYQTQIMSNLPVRNPVDPSV